MLFYVMSCRIMPCKSCHLLSSYAISFMKLMSCLVMLLHVRSCHVWLCCDMLGHVIRGHAIKFTSCIAASLHVIMSCHVTSCHVMSRHVTSRHVMSCHVTSRHVMSCHVMLPCKNGKQRTIPHYFHRISNLGKSPFLYRTLVQIIPVLRSIDVKQDSPAKVIVVFAEIDSLEATVQKVFFIN